jgi:type III restriction enzyme
MGFNMPYEFDGVSRAYEPDLIVRLKDKRIVVLEIKGYEAEQDRTNHQAAERWISTVNNADKIGRWRLHVCKEPHTLGHELAVFARQVW